jgi:uncharacterized SAM-binding protein YcdF (DUF218 family)
MTESTTALFFTKLAPVFIYPIGFVIVLTVASLIIAVFARRGLALILLGLAISWLWVASTPDFADWAIATLERQYPAQQIENLPKADVAIVLGGAVGQPVPPRIDADFNKSFDRVLQAMKLYHAGHVRQLLVTGGNLPWLADVVPEAELIRSFLIDWGNVPGEAIEIRTQSRNTYENAQEIKELTQEKPFESALLITSAAHMPRAMAVFRKAGLPVSAATTDIEALEDVPWTPLRWLPDAAALSTTTDAIKEWLGYLTYRFRGYV